MTKNINQAKEVPTNHYRPAQRHCVDCLNALKRSHILWRKRVTFSTGIKLIVSWGYRCPTEGCPGASQLHRSLQAERLHLWQRRFSRELVVRIGYQRFWQHRTRAELHQWLRQDLQVEISERAVTNLVLDFLALLRAGQAAKIRQKVSQLNGLVIGVDGMQPEKGHDCLYLVRELHSGVILFAENVAESSWQTLSACLFVPLRALVTDLQLPCLGVVSDAQEALRVAAANDLPGVPHQACQAHCLRAAGELTFAADRKLKKELKKAFRQALARLSKRIQALRETDPFRPVLADYALAMRSTLLQGGVAPFELGGVAVFSALEALEGSLLRCQKKPTTLCCAVCSSCATDAKCLPSRWNAIYANANG
jgi:hypothetical protein